MPIAILLILLMGTSLVGASSNQKCIASLVDSLQERSISNYHQDRCITNQELQKELNPTTNNKNQLDASNVTEDIQWNYFRKKVRGGKNVVVELLNGQRIKGKLKEIAADELILLRDNKEIRIHKQEIAKVKKQRKLLKSTLIGLAVGFGGGLILGALTDCKDCDDPGMSYLVFGFYLGPMAGTAAGLTIGLVRSGDLYKKVGVAPAH